jgi:ABC-2 type transport system ATP-binding protein
VSAPVPAIEVRGLRKSYGKINAVDRIDLAVATGEIFALIGPNGAGKTTAVEIMEGYRGRDSGEVSVLGFDPERNEPAFKQRVGIVLQSTAVEPYLTVAELIDLFRSYYPRPRPLAEVLHLTGLEQQRDTRVRRISGGQLRRLDVAVGLAGDPDLLFLDEPTTGFDPSARRDAWQMIKSLSSLGKTIFLTTHYMDEAQELAGRVAIINQGRIVSTGTPAELTSRVGGTRITFRSPPSEALPAELHALRDGGDRVTIETAEPTRALHVLTAWAVERGIELPDLSVSRNSLEDVYLALTAGTENEASE